jgi:hypothetical protein
VRLIGVDTSETEHPKKTVERFDKEATEFTRRMIEGKPVRLEFAQWNDPILAFRAWNEYCVKAGRDETKTIQAVMYLYGK